jgi:hypothetical protein
MSGKPPFKKDKKRHKLKVEDMGHLNEVLSGQLNV